MQDECLRLVILLMVERKDGLEESVIWIELVIEMRWAGWRT